MKRYVMEFLGTFFLVFTVGTVVTGPGAGPFAPLAIGAVLAAMIYAGGHISGAHYNPAVTIAVWLRGSIGPNQILPYLVAQTAGGVLAAVFAGIVLGNPPVPPMEISILPALVAELLFTFALCLVVLEVATSEATKGNSYYGAAIGLTVVAGAYAVGGVSGAAFNPAVVAGLTVMGILEIPVIWVYLLANLAGGFLAAAVYRMEHHGE